MRKSTLCTIFFAVLCCLLLSQPAKAQDVIGYSQITFDESSNTVYGYSSSELVYSYGYHYSAYVEGYLYDEYGNVLSSGYAESYFLAQVVTAAAALPAAEYTVYSDHYLVARYYTTVTIYDCDPYYCRYCYDYYEDPYYGYGDCYDDYWYDPWGFSFLPGGYYGDWWGFYGYGEPANLEIEYIYLGSTADSLVTPPDYCDGSSVETYNPDGYAYASSYDPGATSCSMRPYISGQHELWYFDNVSNPPNYSTKITLTAHPQNAGSYEFRIISGYDKALFAPSGAVTYYTSAPTVDLYSIAPSDAVGDVRIIVRVNGVNSASFKVTVRAPHSLQRTGPNQDYPWNNGYISYIPYQINQKIGNAKMPFDTLINERFPNVHYDFTVNDWPTNPCPGGANAGSGYFFDQVGQQGSPLNPAVCNPGTCTSILVRGLDQEWRVGSDQTGVVNNGDPYPSNCTTAAPAVGQGRLVQRDILEYFTDHGDHGNVVSPTQ